MYLIPIIAGAVLGLALYIYILADDERWLLVSIVSHLLLFLRVSAGSGENPAIGIPEIIFSAIFFPGLLLWFAKRLYAHEIFVKGWEDIILIAFLIYALLGIFVSASQGFSLEKGIREFLLFVPLLFIFPVRKEAEKKNGRTLMIWALLLMSAAVGLVIITRYRLDLLAAKYLWQVVGNRQQKEESLYMSSIIILFAFVVGNRYSKTILLPLLALEMFALAITFSRGYWITTVLGLLGLLFFLKGQARRRMMRLTVVGVLFAAVVGIVVLPQIFGSFLTGLAERLTSISTNALTLHSRLVESEAVLQKVSLSPVIGYGLGSLFSYFDVITHLDIRTWYIHNGYLFLLFKFGIVGFVLFISMYMKRVVTLVRLWQGTSFTDENPFVSAILLISLMMLFISVTSPQFYDRGSLLILSITWGIGDSLLSKKIS